MSEAFFAGERSGKSFRAGYDAGYSKGHEDGYNAAIRVQEQNEPLTLEQLLGMDGKPVWFEVDDSRDGKIQEHGIVGIEEAAWLDESGEPVTTVTVFGKNHSEYVLADTMFGFDNEAKAYAREPKHAPDSGKE